MSDGMSDAAKRQEEKEREEMIGKIGKMQEEMKSINNRIARSAAKLHELLHLKQNIEGQYFSNSSMLDCRGPNDGIGKIGD